MKTGRPKVWTEEMWGTLEKTCKLNPTLKDCAAILGVSEDTIQREIKAFYGITFAAYLGIQMAEVRGKLINAAIIRGLSGSDSMLIFSLKNLCKWSDRPVEDQSENKSESIEQYLKRTQENESGTESKVSEPESIIDSGGEPEGGSRH